MIKHILVGVLGLSVAIAGAPESSNHSYFALSEFTMTGPNGAVRTVMIAITSGNRQACEAHLAGFRHGQARSKNAAYVKKVREVCLTELPPELKGITEGRPIPEAYYVTQELQLSSSKVTHVVVMYGIDQFDPEEMCKLQADRFRAKDKNARCVPPAK